MSKMIQEIRQRQTKKKTFHRSVHGAVRFIQILTLVMGATAFVLSAYAFFFFLLAIVPTLVALMVDRRNTRSASSTIAAFNLIGLAPYMQTLFQNSDISGTAQMLLGNLSAWSYIYGMAALGWLLVWIVPQIWAIIFVSNTENKVQLLYEMQEKLRDEWSDEVTEYSQQKSQNSEHPKGEENQKHGKDS